MNAELHFEIESFTFAGRTTSGSEIYNFSVVVTFPDGESLTLLRCVAFDDSDRLRWYGPSIPPSPPARPSRIPLAFIPTSWRDSVATLVIQAIARMSAEEAA